MKVLNLSEGFNPLGNTEAETVLFDSFKFPGGEQHIKIKSAIPDEEVWITVRLNSSNDIMLLLLANDALRRAGVAHVSLFAPYFPYARQDRTMVPGESLSVSVMASLINSCGFHKVRVFDPHSDVTAALLHRCETMPNHSLVKAVLARPDVIEPLIVSPDAGAEKKIYGLCQAIGYTGEIIFGKKHRDVKTGKLTNVSAEYVPGMENQNLFIVDDICDGGGTFTMLAEKLKQYSPKSVNLIVSHGIFSRGLPIEGIDHVYTTDSISNLPDNQNFKQYRLASLK